MTRDPADLMDDARRCRAHAKRTGQRCKRAAIPDGTVCTVHGGAARQVRAAAGHRRQEHDALAAVTIWGLPLDISPTEALLQEVQRSAGAVAWLGAQVRALDLKDVVWGVTKQTSKQATESPGIDTVQEAKVNLWVDLYIRERRHLAAVATAALAAGVEERRVRLAEEVGELVGETLRGVLSGLGLTAEQEEQARTLVPQQLRSLAARIDPDGRAST